MAWLQLARAQDDSNDAERERPKDAERIAQARENLEYYKSERDQYAAEEAAARAALDACEKAHGGGQ